MSTMQAEGTMQELVEDAKGDDDYAQVFKHEDGSVTVVKQDPFGWERNPREDYDHFARLVADDSYADLDQDDAGIAEVRAAAEQLTYLGERWYMEVYDDGRAFFNVLGYYDTTFDLDDTDDARVVRAYLDGLDAEEMVLRYIEEERPDVLYYADHWRAIGSSPSDWREGWGYVTVEDFHRAGAYADGPAEARHWARKTFEGELKEYAAWFAGEVYMATHIYPVAPAYEVGDQGGYYTGETLGATDSAYGFIDPSNDQKWIGGEFANSPIIEEL